MHTLHVFVRDIKFNACVLPLKQNEKGEWVEDKNFGYGDWPWPEYIKPFLKNRKTLSIELCRSIHKLGVCTFVQHVDPNHLIELK
jgi:hypothetical protein